MPAILPRPRIGEPDSFPADWHPLVREIYAARVPNVSQVEKRLQYLLPPDGIPDIERAAERLSQAIDDGETILVYGDYDVDGATSTALMVRVLRAIGGKVDYFIPNRMTHGYGLSVQGIDAIATFPSLWVTVDNGIRSIDAAAYLAQKGIDLIITDHHEPADVLPQAIAVVNPKRVDSQFASENLSGVGVAFYVLLALRRYRLANSKAFPCNPVDYLDLVALGTVADIVPLDFNNRILVQAGIKRLQQGQGNVGIRALCAVSNVRLPSLNPSDFGFSIAPRLNAVGRLEDMSDGVAMLLTDDWVTANDYARLLDELNAERKAIEREMTEQAAKDVDCAQPIVSAYLPDGHEGIIGIVAGRLKGRFGRPALVATDTVDGEKIKASLRSISGVDIYALLEHAAKHLPENCLQFGGHQMAAGLTVAKDQYATLITMLNRAFSESIGNDIPEEPLYVDGELPADLLDIHWARYLEHLEPWGQGLPVPTFCNTFIVHDCRRLGAHHTRLILREPYSGKQLSATWFFTSADYQYGATLQVVYQVQVNRFYGDERLNLLISHAIPQS